MTIVKYSMEQTQLPSRNWLNSNQKQKRKFLLWFYYFDCHTARSMIMLKGVNHNVTEVLSYWLSFGKFPTGDKHAAIMLMICHTYCRFQKWYCRTDKIFNLKFSFSWPLNFSYYLVPTAKIVTSLACKTLLLIAMEILKEWDRGEGVGSVGFWLSYYRVTWSPLRLMIPPSLIGN